MSTETEKEKVGELHKRLQGLRVPKHLVEYHDKLMEEYCSLPAGNSPDEIISNVVKAAQNLGYS